MVMQIKLIVVVVVNKNEAYSSLAFSIRRRVRGRVVRALDSQFGSLEFKSRPDRKLDLFTVVPRSNPQPHL